MARIKDTKNILRFCDSRDPVISWKKKPLSYVYFLVVILFKRSRGESGIFARAGMLYTNGRYASLVTVLALKLFLFEHWSIATKHMTSATGRWIEEASCSCRGSETQGNPGSDQFTGDWPRCAGTILYDLDRPRNPTSRWRSQLLGCTWASSRCVSSSLPRDATVGYAQQCNLRLTSIL